MKRAKLVLTAAVALSVFFSSCDKKDKMKNIATIDYTVMTTNRTDGLVQWNSGTGSGKQVVFKGNGATRVEDYKLNFNSVDFFANGNYLGTTQVPEGTYTDAEFNYQMIPSRNPALQLKGTFNNGTTTTPVTVNIDQFVEIRTVMPSVTLQGGRSHAATLKLNLAQMMNGITPTMLNNATRTNGEIVIGIFSNTNLLQNIVNNINNVMKHEVDIK